MRSTSNVSSGRWARAWLDSIAALYPESQARLSRGSTWVGDGRVTDIELSPGQISAQIWNTDAVRTTLHVRRLTEPQQAHLVEVVVEQTATIAALLGGELPYALDSLILPTAGDLSVDCECSSGTALCTHAAALVHAVASLVDADPYTLLSLRGSSRSEITTNVQRIHHKRLGLTTVDASHLPRGADPGTSAAAAYRREPQPLERSASLAAQPGRLRPLASAPPADTGIAVNDLSSLVADAAQRAWAMLAEGTTSGLELSTGSDVVRRAANGDVESIAGRTGIDANELAAAAAAWRAGGEPGFRALRDRWQPPHDALTPGIDALTDLEPDTIVKTRENTVTVGAIQLRLDEQGYWWRFEHDPQLGWLLAAPGSPIAAEALSTTNPNGAPAPNGAPNPMRATAAELLDNAAPDSGALELPESDQQEFKS